MTHSRYRCPACRVTVMKADGHYYLLGPWHVHNRCAVTCTLCDKPIKKPPFGQAYRVVAWLGEPVHQECKEKEQKQP